MNFRQMTFVEFHSKFLCSNMSLERIQCKLMFLTTCVPSVQVGNVIMTKSALGATVVNRSAIILSFIGVGFSMFSLSRLQNSSERREILTGIFK